MKDNEAERPARVLAFPVAVVDYADEWREEEAEAHDAGFKLDWGDAPPPLDPTPNARMVITRHLSQDGQQNSISVSFEYALGDDSVRGIKAKAQQALSLQNEIINEYYAQAEVDTTSGNDLGVVENEAHDNSVSAVLREIGAPRSRRGGCYFITADLGSRQARLYGTPRQLVTYLARIGHDLTPDAISEGLQLNFPCRVVVQPSKQGRSLTIVELLPPR
jgi:hypothetical protein